MSPRWTSYIVSKPLKGWRKYAKCPKFEAAISPKRYEIGCQSLLITNRKSHTDFRLVPTLMTLDDPEWRNSPYFAFLPISISLLAKYVAVVEYRLILSVNIVSQFQSSTFYSTVFTFIFVKLPLACEWTLYRGCLNWLSPIVLCQSVSQSVNLSVHLSLLCVTQKR